MTTITLYKTAQLPIVYTGGIYVGDWAAFLVVTRRSTNKQPCTQSYIYQLANIAQCLPLNYQLDS